MMPRRALAWIFFAEGGLAKLPDDPGGITNLGVSLRAVRLRDHDRDGRLDFDLNHDGVVDEKDIMLIRPADAERLYAEDYWSLGGTGIEGTCDDFPADLGIAVFDCGVNCGTRTAVALLQRVLGVNPDGIVGGSTRQALARALMRGVAVVPAYNLARFDYYHTLKNAPTHLYGWTCRLFRLLKWLPEHPQ